MEKKCIKCGEIKPIDDFYMTFHKIMKKNYYFTTCKVCKNKYTLQYYRENKIELKEKITEREKINNKINEFGIYWWSNELFEYIKSKNLFNEEELENIKYYLKKIDELGNV